jgi:hypothetical protein
MLLVGVIEKHIAIQILAYLVVQCSALLVTVKHLFHPRAVVLVSHVHRSFGSVRDAHGLVEK